MYDVETSVAQPHLTVPGRGYWVMVGVLLVLLFVAVPLGLVAVQAPDHAPPSGFDGQPASDTTP